MLIVNNNKSGEGVEPRAEQQRLPVTVLLSPLRPPRECVFTSLQRDELGWLLYSPLKAFGIIYEPVSGSFPTLQYYK